MYLDPFVKHSHQKQNLLVCKAWYNAFMRESWKVKNPEFVDWITTSCKVKFKGKYKDFKYRIEDLQSRSVKVTLKTKNIKLLPKTINKLVINTDSDVVLGSNFNIRKLEVYSGDGGIEIRGLSMNMEKIWFESESGVDMYNSTINADTMYIGVRNSYTVGNFLIDGSTINCNKFTVFDVDKFRMRNSTIIADEIDLDIEYCEHVRFVNSVIRARKLTIGLMGIQEDFIGMEIHAEILCANMYDPLYYQLQDSIIGLKKVISLYDD